MQTDTQGERREKRKDTSRKTQLAQSTKRETRKQKFRQRIA